MDLGPDARLERESVEVGSRCRRIYWTTSKDVDTRSEDCQRAPDLQKTRVRSNEREGRFGGRRTHHRRGNITCSLVHGRHQVRQRWRRHSPGNRVLSARGTCADGEAERARRAEGTRLG